MEKTDKLIDWNENERVDHNRDGIDDRISPPIPDISAGSRKLADKLRQNTSTDPTLSGGDIDAQWEMAESAGDEAAAGSMPTPEQDRVDDIGRAIGVTYEDNEPLRVGEKERERDKRRWELDPASSDDYRDRVRNDE